MASTFTELLQELMNESKIKTAELAVAIGISTSHMHNLINGNRHPTYEMIKKLSDFFNVSTVDLFQAAGLLDEYDETEFKNQQIIELLKKNEKFKKLADILAGMDPEERNLTIEKITFFLEMNQK